MHKRQHIDDLGIRPSIGDLKALIKKHNIPDDAILSGWDDQSVGVIWWAPETPTEEKDRIYREAQAQIAQNQRG